MAWGPSFEGLQRDIAHRVFQGRFEKHSCPPSLRARWTKVYLDEDRRPMIGMHYDQCSVWISRFGTTRLCSCCHETDILWQIPFNNVSAVLWIVFKTNRKWDEPTNTFPASLLYLENTFEVSLVNIRRYYKRLISGINLVIDDISRNTDMSSRCRTANCLVQVNTVNGALNHNRIHPQGIELHRCGLNGCNYLALSAAKVQTHRATHPQ